MSVEQLYSVSLALFPYALRGPKVKRQTKLGSVRAYISVNKQIQIAKYQIVTVLCKKPKWGMS